MRARFFVATSEGLRMKSPTVNEALNPICAARCQMTVRMLSDNFFKRSNNAWSLPGNPKSRRKSANKSELQSMQFIH